VSCVLYEGLRAPIEQTIGEEKKINEKTKAPVVFDEPRWMF
jgi:hypothetical protein